MSIRIKTFFISLTTFFLLIVLIAITSHSILLESYRELEESSVKDSVRWTECSINDKINALDTFNNDWASWDDTYEFIEDNNQDYIDSNLVDETFLGAELNMMLFFNSTDHLVFGKAFDLVDEIEIPVPQELLDNLSDNQYLLTHEETESNHTGLILLPQDPMLISSRPILTSQEEGPVMGTLIMGRYLDSQKIEELGAITHLTLSAYLLDDPNMPPQFQEAVGLLSEGESIFVKPMDDDTITGYTFIEDIYGIPVLVLGAEMSRDIYSQGERTMNYLVWFLLLSCIILIVVFTIILEKSVLSRLTHLNDGVCHIGNDKDLSQRLNIRGHDEISNLALEVNTMLATIEDYHNIVRENEEKFKEFFESANDMIQSIDANGNFMYVNKKWLNALGYTQNELENMIFTDIIREDQIPHCRGVFEEVCRGDSFENIETVFLAKDGHEITVEGNVNAQMIDGKFVATQGIFRDVTVRKLTEEKLQRTLEDLERFNRLAVGRELRMIELKEEVNELLHSMGKERKYSIKTSGDLGIGTGSNNWRSHVGPESKKPTHQ